MAMLSGHVDKAQRQVYGSVFAGGKRVAVADSTVGFEFMLCLGFVACCFIPDEPASGVVSVILLAMFIILVLVSAPQQVIKYLPFYFNVVVNVVGCMICEYQVVYLKELVVYSGFVGSLPLLVFGRWAFLEVLIIYDRHFGVEKELLSIGDYGPRAKSFLNVASIASVFLLGVLFVYILPNPAFNLSIDRFAYAQLYVPGLLSRLWAAMGFFIVLPVLAYRESKNRFGLVATVLFVLCGLWMGHKFGVFFNLLCVFAFVYYDRVLQYGKRRLAKLCGCLAIALILLSIGAVTINGILVNTTNDEYLYQRTAQQGQLWWRTYALSEGGAHLDQVSVELGGIGRSTTISDNVGSHFGIYGIMYLTAPASMIDAKIARGSRYTEAGYATAYYCFGFIGPVLFSLVLGVIVAFTYNALIRSLFERRLLESVLFVRLTVILRSVLATAVFGSLLTSITLLSYAVLFFLALARRVSSSNSRTLGSQYRKRTSGAYALRTCNFLAVPMDELLVDRREAAPASRLVKPAMNETRQSGGAVR